ncbi:MAG: hypothetical protein Q4Q53_08000 [Methanocorpusculum sp.]|nr:hypothetical protein [Methanocorpusculum sp.]
MSTKIYVRERNKTEVGDQKPRFRVVAITGDRTKVRFDASHFRKTELETIVSDVGAELIYLEPMTGEECGKRHNSD